MTMLAACPSCSRHVRIDEPTCPFCAASLDRAFADRPAPIPVLGRLSRAALVALGASAVAAGTMLGCGDDDTSTTPLYGAPAPAADSGTDANNASSGAIYGAPPDSGGGGAPLYGAPPGSE